MALNLFGYTIGKTPEEQKNDSKKVSFVPPADKVDGGYSIEPAGGHFGHFLDTSGANYKGEIDLIMKYRKISMTPEVDAAIEDIVSEAIVSDEDSAPIELVTEDINLPDKIKEAIHNEFEGIVELLNFNWYGHEIFRRWYVDGRLYYHKIIDKDNPKNGIIEIRPIDPIRMQRKKEAVKQLDEKGNEVIKEIKEFYVYSRGPAGNALNPYGAGASVQQFTPGGGSQGSVQVLADAVTFASSGMLDETRTMVVGHLHKALKTGNQLGMLEDALVVYRLARAPERRIFYIDVGNLPKGKAEEYVNGMMSRYRNKMTYDASTGEYKDGPRHMSMLEDFWLPRREGGKGTEISTLPGGDNLGQIDDVVYFQKKLYNSLGVPSSRLNSDDNPMVSIGRANETTREELKYQRFIARLRKRFSILFMDLLKDQLILKGIMTHQEWNEVSQDISVNFSKQNYFAELTQSEILRDRVATVREMDEFVGRYYSIEYVRKNILKQSDEDIKLIDGQIKKEEPLMADKEDGDDVSFDNSKQEEVISTQTRLLKSLHEFVERDDTTNVVHNLKAISEQKNGKE